MSKGKRRNVSERDGKSENEKIRTLKKALTQRDREIARLKAELKTLNEAFRKSAAYMSSQSKELTVEELIKAAGKNQTLEQTKVEKVKETKEDVREKVLRWRNERYGKYEEE